MPTSAILAIAASRVSRSMLQVDHALKVREPRLVQCSNHVRGSSMVDLHRSIRRQLYPPIAVAIAATAKMPFVCHKPTYAVQKKRTAIRSLRRRGRAAKVAR
jgi:hypothetical protein